MSAIERHVCTVIAKGLNVVPEHVRPETVLFAGSVSEGQLRAIVKTIERDLKIKFPELAYLGWTSVGDVVDAAERADAAKSKRAAKKAMRRGEAA